MKRPFHKVSEDTIQFDNGNVVTFHGNGDCAIKGKPVTVKVFMEYLLSKQYLIDYGYDLDDE